MGIFHWLRSKKSTANKSKNIASSNNAPHSVTLFTLSNDLNDASEKVKTYSIILRLQRISYEDAYVAVPVTSDIMNKKKDENDKYHMNTDAMWAKAVQLGNDQRVEWKVESVRIEPHEIQIKPKDRKVLDGFRDLH